MTQTTATRSHIRPSKPARHRVSKIASARDTIDGFGHGMDVAGLTYGQFSLLDLIQAALEVTGPADVAISTWSAGLYDVDAADRFVSDGRIRGIRFLMDSASQKRGQASAVQVADLFGAEAIRTTRTHAKFAVITNGEWNVVITSSMNLNLNPRCEQFEMTDDPDRAAMFLGYVDEIWGELPAGGERRSDDRQLPQLRGIDGVQPALGIEVTPKIRTGVWE